MKLSYNWLKDLVPGLTASPADVAEKLTMHSFETTAKGKSLEADITPNRAHDTLSHLGIAREIAALYELSVQEPAFASLPAAQTEVDGFTIAIDDASHTPRYLNVLLQSVNNNKPSPHWLKTRLDAGGVRPVNTVVDITNYVLLETGQPSHAFDADRLPGKTMSVREAAPNERLTFLSGEAITVPPSGLVVTSGDNPVALAGIMGASDSAVTPQTRTLLLEVANFHPFTIRQTADTLNLRTEASIRFGRGLSPAQVAPAAARLVYLLQTIVGAQVLGVTDHYPRPARPNVIAFNPASVAAVAGVSVTSQQIRQALSSLRLIVDDTTTPWQITPPPERLDLTGEHDLVEEVIRLHDLNDIPTQALSAPVSYPPQPAAALWRAIIRNLLVTRGLTETYNVPFAPSNLVSQHFDTAQPITLSNPLDPAQCYLRTSLLPSLMANLRKNKDDFHRQFSTQTKALFEIGHVYQRGQGLVPGIREEEHLAAVLVGEAADATDLIAAIYSAFSLTQDDDDIIWAGPFSDAVRTRLKYRVPLTALEINLDRLYKRAGHPPFKVPTLDSLAQASPAPRYCEFSRYPGILRDISFVVDANQSAEQAQTIIEKAGTPLLAAVELFDQFNQAGKTSLAFHLEYQTLDRTLTSAEVNTAHNRIIEALQTEIKAHIK